MYEVEFYKDYRDRCQVIDFLGRLQVRERAKVSKWIEMLKRKRVEAITDIYHKCKETNQMKNALGALYQIQGEVEKAQTIGTQTNYQINIFKDMSEEELEQEKVKSLERLKALKQIPEIKAEEIPDVQ